MTRKEYDDCLAETKRLFEEGIFTWYEYEAVIKITFDRMYKIKVDVRRTGRKRFPS